MKESLMQMATLAKQIQSITDYYEFSNIGNCQQHWELVSKKPVGQELCFIFENKSIGATVLVVDDDYNDYVSEIGPMLFFVYYHSGIESYCVSFSPKSYADRHKNSCHCHAPHKIGEYDVHSLPDSHLAWLIENYYGVPSGLLDEKAENVFSFNSDKLDIIKKLESLGLVNGGAMEDPY